MNFNIAASGLSTSKKNIDVISNNIANETTEGYRKQVLQNEEAISIKKDGFQQGTGSITGTIHQTVDNIIYKNMLKQIGDKSFSEAMVKYSSNIESLYQDNNGNGILSNLNNIFNSAIDLKNNMENKALEGVFVDNLNIFSENTRTLNSNLVDLKNNVIASIVEDINNLNNQLSDLHDVVKSLSVSFKPDLADKQALLEQSISSEINAKITYDKDGNYNLLIGNNRILDKNSFSKFSLKNNKIVLEKSNVDITNTLTKGSISAKAKISISKNNEIDKNLLKLDLMSNSVVKEFNSIYSGKAFNTSQSKSFIQNNLSNIPLLDIPELKGINPGNITFTLHSSPVEEYTVNINHKTTMASIKADIETQSNGEILLSNNGNNLSIYSPKYPVQISNDENTNFKQVFEFNQLMKGSSSSNIEVNRDILNHPDKLFVDNNLLQNNTNYDIIDNIADLQFKEVDYKDILKYSNYYNMENFNPSNTTINSLEKNTIKGFYQNITLSVSQTVSRNQNKLDLQSKIYETTHSQYTDDTNVNKDEELMNLMKYQAAYAANAKVITTMNELMDTILKM